MQRFGTLTIDADARRVQLDGQVVVLTKSEFALLLALVSRAGTAVSYRELLEAMWGTRWEAETTPLQVHVSRLRRKLGESGAAPHYIVTVHGFGYRFEPEHPVLTEAAVTPEGLARLGSADVTHEVLYLLASPSHVIQWASPNVEAVLGWRPHDLVGRSVYDFMRADDPLSPHESRFELDSGQPAAAIGSLRTATGGRWRTEAYVRPVRDEAGDITGFLGHFRPLADTPNPSAVRSVTLIADRDVVLRDISPRVPVLGWDPEEIIGTCFSPTGLDESAARSLVSGLLATGARTISGVISALHRDGTTSPMEAVTNFDFDENGEFAGLRTTLQLPVDPATS